MQAQKQAILEGTATHLLTDKLVWHCSPVPNNNHQQRQKEEQERRKPPTAWMALASTALTKMAVVPLSMMAVVASSVTACPPTLAPLSATVQYLHTARHSPLKHPETASCSAF